MTVHFVYAASAFFILGYCSQIWLRCVIRTRTVTSVNDDSSRVFATAGLTSSSNGENHVICLFLERPSNTLLSFLSVRLPNKNDRIDEVSVSSMSKHSDVSDNDADKSADETEDERKRWKLKEPDASIASHYANDPFYKSWRNSLDKKTRKAILAEYHKKAHQRDDEGSSESIANLKSMPRATSEERLDRPRGRPGRSDLSEKRKLTQSDPYLPQECEPSPASVSSFSPKERHRQAPRGRPGRRAIDRSVARSEPSLNRGSESDSDSRYPPPYEDNNLRKSRRQDSFLRATHGDSPVMRRSRDNISPEKSKKELIAELDNKVDRYTRYPPPYEDDYYSANESRPPPAYTPRQDSRQDSSDEGRSSYVGYQNNQRQWRPKRSDEDRNDRYRSPEFMERRVIHDDQFDGYEFDELDAPSRTSMTLV